jgi:hypothetical protein
MRCTCAFRHHTLEVPSIVLHLSACVNIQAMRCTCAVPPVYTGSTKQCPATVGMCQLPGNALHLCISPPYTGSTKQCPATVQQCTVQHMQHVSTSRQCAAPVHFATIHWKYQAMPCNCWHVSTSRQCAAHVHSATVYWKFQELCCTCRHVSTSWQCALHMGIPPPYYVVTLEVGLGGTTSAI